MDLPVNYNELSWAARKFVREEYCLLQENKCYYCGGDLNLLPPIEVMGIDIDRSLFPPKFFEHPIHLHHSHKTGMTIGAVHCHCNAVLWQYHGE